MKKSRVKFLFIAIILFAQLCPAQEAQLPVPYAAYPTEEPNEEEFPEFRAKELILPAAAIGYGFLALKSPTLIDWNESIHESLVGDKEVSVDDHGMYLPILTTYALDLFTHDAKHNFKDRTIILLTATAINNGVTFGLKEIIDEKRPGEDKYDSFPSGHTSNAFMGAEFLRQEFKDASPWYGVLGYGMGVTTAYLRLYNNKHWFSDVVAGSAVGILSTKVAYWTYPWMKEHIFKTSNTDYDVSLYPGFEQNAPQIGVLFVF